MLRVSYNKISGFIIVTFLLVGAIVFLNGCGKSESNAETGASSDGGEITLRILENDTAKSQGYLDELLNAFNEAYADEGITAVDANMEEYSNLAENGPYGYGPDVIYQANDQIMTYAEDKHILALNVEDYECYDQIPQEAWDAFKIQVDGKDYYCGVPVNVQEPMLFYRADMLPENWESEWDDDGNGTPDFLENWNDLYALSNEIVNEGTGKYGFVASMNDLYMMAEYIFSYGGYVFGTDADGNVNSEDIGFNQGDAATGMLAFKQFAALMGEECIDDSVKTSRYSNVANGTYFASVSTPDTYVLFHERLVEQYQSEGMSAEDAEKAANDNLMMVELPGLMPANGDLSTDSSSTEFIQTKVMGGVNGYAISAYTEHKEACQKFIDFATSYDCMKLRADMLGIAPTRADVAAELGGVTDSIFNSLNEGNIYLMPSVKAVDQIWDPMQTLLSDVAKDAFRAQNGETEKYTDVSSMQEALDNAAKSIYDAIYTLAN